MPSNRTLVRTPVHVTLECGAGHRIEADTRLALQPGPGARKLA